MSISSIKLNYFHLNIIPMILYMDNLHMLWFPLKTWTLKTCTIANFVHSFSKSWLRPCLCNAVLDDIISKIGLHCNAACHADWRTVIAVGRLMYNGSCLLPGPAVTCCSYMLEVYCQEPGNYGRAAVAIHHSIITGRQDRSLGSFLHNLPTISNN